jgi:hypothetical protein
MLPSHYVTIHYTQCTKRFMKSSVLLPLALSQSRKYKEHEVSVVLKCFCPMSKLMEQSYLIPQQLQYSCPLGKDGQFL